MSPLSDTTNLAPAMAGTDLFTHIRHMTKTTVPSILITFILFGGIGMMYEVNETVIQTKEISAVILEKFNINGWLFIVPIVVILMIVKKVPAVPALFVGSILGGLFAVIFQPQIIQLIADEPGAGYAYQSFKAVMMSLYGEVSIVTSNAVVNELLITGGMAGMLNTIWLIVAAMGFGGIMEKSGMLTVIAAAVIAGQPARCTATMSDGLMLRMPMYMSKAPSVGTATRSTLTITPSSACEPVMLTCSPRACSSRLARSGLPDRSSE